jgi:predicted nucleic acid-binding protein
MVMIFVDANVFLRALTEPRDQHAARHARIAHELLRQADRGEVEITTSDAILAEVAFVLSAKAHYQLSAAAAATLINSIVQLRGFRHRDKAVIERALALWASVPRLGFVDALAAAYAHAPGIHLATFDSHFDGLPGITRWEPPDAA